MHTFLHKQHKGNTFVRETIIMKLRIHILFTLTKLGYNRHSYWDVIRYAPRRTTTSSNSENCSGAQRNIITLPTSQI
jgi:hypothetical protein